MPKFISATGSYWNGRIPVAISNFSGKFIGVLCTETVEATMPLAVESCRDVTTNLWLYGSKQTLGQNTPDHAATAVISLAHSAVTYWSCFAIHKHLRHLKINVQGPFNVRHVHAAWLFGAPVALQGFRPVLLARKRCCLRQLNSTAQWSEPVCLGDNASGPEAECLVGCSATVGMAWLNESPAVNEVT